MSEEQAFEDRAFRAKVLGEIKTLKLMVELRAGERERRDGLDQSAGAALNFFKFVVHDVIGYYPLDGLKKWRNIDALDARARAFLETPETRRVLCPALLGVEKALSKLSVRSTETDAAEIASAITPLLTPRGDAGGVFLPPDPMLYALCAWLIARTGVRVYCDGEAAQT